MADVSFRRMTEGDLPLIAAWLREEHVQEWWKDPSAPEGVEAKYLPRINGVDPTEMLIIVWEGRDVGMIQRYRMCDHPGWKRSLAPSGLTFSAAAGIDYMIGVRNLIGRGIGSAVVATFSADVFARHPDVGEIVVTPQAANRASCRVLEKAGYRLAWTGMLDSNDPSDAGPAALYVLDRPGPQNPRTVLRDFVREDQVAVRSLILEGLRGHWGDIDETLNSDLEDIASSYASGRTLVALHLGRIVGTGTLMPRDGNVAEIVRMSVDAGAGRHGVGRTMVAELIRTAQAWRVRAVVLETTTVWDEVVAFYTSCGFDITHQEDGAFGPDTWFRYDL